MPPADREPRVRPLAQEHYRRPFDLAHGPLYRVHLLRLGDREHVALITLHHLVSDGWSIGVFLRELGQLYARATRGRGRPAAAACRCSTPISPAGSRNGSRATSTPQQLTYWTERLADAPQVLDLPTDRPRPPLLSTRGATRTRTLPAELAADRPAIQPAGRRHAVHDAAGRVPRRARPALRSGRSARRHAGRQPQPGRDSKAWSASSSTRWSLRGDLRGDPTFRELLTRTREDSCRRSRTRTCPFEHLVEALKARRDPSRTPLFQVMFAYETAPAALHLPGLSLEPVPVDRGTAMFDLTLTVTDARRGTDRVAPSTTPTCTTTPPSPGLLRHYETLLDPPDWPIPISGSLRSRWTDAAETRRVVEDWNATALDYPRDRTVHALIAEQAARTPDAVALIHEGGTLTYAELIAAADRLGRPLAVYRRPARSRSSACASIARPTWRSACSASSKPAPPTCRSTRLIRPTRLSFLIADAGVRLILAQSHLTAQIPTFAGTVCAIDAMPQPDPTAAESVR